MSFDTNYRLHALANASVLDSVDARTRLAGSNVMEHLLFSLGSAEVFGINVFKVREITRTPAIARAPNLPPSVLATMNNNRTAGGFTPTMQTVLIEQEVAPAEFLIAGQQSLQIEVIK